MARTVASASTYGGRDEAWNYGAVSPAARWRAASASRDDVFLAMDLEHAASLAGHGECPQQCLDLLHPEVVDHERLERRDPSLTAAGSSAAGSSWTDVRTRLTA